MPINLDAHFIIDTGRSLPGSEKRKALEKEILNDLIGEVIIHKDGTEETILNFPLARWLSRTVIKRMVLLASPTNFTPQTKALLDKIKNANRIIPPTSDAYIKVMAY